MRPRLNLSLRRALMAAMATACTLLSTTAWGGVADARYDLQYYLDFARNKGMFAAGATNISVYFKDGNGQSNPTIPLMPNLDSYAQRGQVIMGSLSPLGGANLMAPQYVNSAYHCPESDVYFLSENGSMSVCYSSTGYTGTGAGDWSMQRLNKIVTEVAYTPMASADFLLSLTSGDWLYRLGNGGSFDTEGNGLNPGSNALGGMIDVASVSALTNQGDYRIHASLWSVGPPLEIGVTQGDSGSPVFAWDAANNRFLYLASLSSGYPVAGYSNYLNAHNNPEKAQAFMDNYTINVSGFSGADTITWGTQDGSTGKGQLTQGDTTYEYTGSGSSNSVKDHLGLTFSTEDAENVQTLELQGSVNMGAGALTFDSGSWKLTETDASHTFNSAGFVVNAGADLTLELTAGTNEEWRKVGEGIMTIAGSGDNNAVLRVGGGETKYIIETDESGNITGCTLGNAGETRLNRVGGYAASSVRLEAGVAIIVLMADNQFKTNTTAGDTFTFGNAGGLLNLNGHDLTWGVINQQGSGTGARIGNFTPLNETTPGKATFTYTGTGTFQGCFMDEGADGAQLAVKYNNADGGTWILTGNHSNAGGFIVESGTMVLQGSNTPHVLMTDSGDWTYATMEGTDVSVMNGATFQLSHHALMTGNVTVENGGSFVLNQTVNAVSESISGSLRQDMTDKFAYSFKGDVTLNTGATMRADISSPVATTMQGNITGTDTSITQFTKQGSGVLVVQGNVNIPVGAVEAGGLVIHQPTDSSKWWRWDIGEQGFLAVVGMENSAVLNYVGTSSSGVLALTQDQTTALDLSYRQNLYIGAYGDEAITYGTADAELAANTNGQWLLGGGTGTLEVAFKLTGENDLIIGNEYSSGTVHLTNTSNDFTGTIYIKGLGNMLTYENGALGQAKVSLSYGNAMSLYDASQFDIIDTSASGVLAIASGDAELNLSGKNFSLGANGDLTYTGTLTVGAEDTYRFGGVGNLTLDTALDGSSSMELDGQGMSGSSVTFARQNAFAGDIVAGGGLYLDSPNSTGNIAIHAGHEEALAAVSSIELQKGATLYTDGQNLTVSNLSVQSGAYVANTTTQDSTLQLHITKDSTIANGSLQENHYEVAEDVYDVAGIHLVKTGAGTLTLGQHTSWTGGLTVKEGTVKVNGNCSDTVGLGITGMSIMVEADGTLDLTFNRVSSADIDLTRLPQYIKGNGTVRVSSGGAILFSDNATGFTGTVEVAGNTRLHIGSNLIYDISASSTQYSNLSVFKDAAVKVTDGSQVRITNMYRYGNSNAAAVSTSADFIIAGTGFKGSDTGAYANNSSKKLLSASLNAGALSVDLNSVITGNVTLAADATIASWSAGALVTTYGNYAYCSTQDTNGTYGLKNKLGGTIRGLILGVEEADGSMSDLTLGGNEGLTFTADSANTYGDLVISNGNGNNDDKFALRLNGGAARSQTSTALGTGSVTLQDGLILRLAGTGTADNTDIVYTYENAINAGAGATLQSYNITNRLTNAVVMSGDSLNLATANGGVLELAGGINGSGTLNVAAGSKVILGSASAGYAMARTGSAQFSGTVAAGAGADITLASPAVVAADTTFTGTDSLTLRLSGTEDFTLGGISLAGSQVTVDEVTTTTPTSLTLHFDFTNTPVAAEADTWSTLTLTDAIIADSTTIALDLNMFSEINSGSYTLISQAGSSTTYTLADTMNGRLSLSTETGALVFIVGGDNRLYWRTDGESQLWNTTDANWYSDATASQGLAAFTDSANVMLDATGTESGNSAENRETITLSDTLTVDTIGVQDAAYELTGSGAISATSLTVGAGGDLKLSNTGDNTFANGVLVNNASLSVNSTGALDADVSVENEASFALVGGSMTGQLTVTDSTASLSNATLTGNIKTDGTGSLSLSAATFSNADSSIAFDYGSLSVTAGTQLGGTFSWVENQPTVQVENMAIAGGTLTSTVALQADSLDMASGSALVLNHSSGAQSSVSTITGAGSLTKQGSDALSLGSAALSYASLQGGETSITGATTISGLLSVAKATLNIEEGGSLTVSQFTAGNERNGNSSVVNINGGTLTITGSTAGDTNSSSFLLAHWKELTSVLTLNSGSIVAENATMHMGWDSGGTFKALGGEATLKGVLFGTSSDGSGSRYRADTFELGTATTGSATLKIGSAGFAGIHSDDTVKFGEGTITATADFAISGAAEPAVQLIGTVGGTIFDTNGHTITVNTAINGEGKVTKRGTGTLALTGSGAAFTGQLAVEAGALKVDTVSKDLFASATSVSIGSSAVLDLSAIDFAVDDNAISLGSSTTVSFADSATVALGSLEEDTIYSIFNAGIGVLDGWVGLSVANFTMNGTKMADMGRVSLSLDTLGSFSYSIDSWDLVWNGPATGGTWDTTDAEWQTTRPNAETGEPETISTAFVNNDNVTFNSTASVSLSSNITANEVRITNGATLTLSSNVLTANKITIESGSKLNDTFASVLAGVKTFELASGAELGIKYNGSPTYTSEVMGEEGTIVLSGGGIMTWNPANGGALNMGTLAIQGNGTRFTTSSTLKAGAVEMEQGTTATLNGTSTIGSMTAASATLNLGGNATVSGTAAVGTLTVSAGTSQFNSGTEIATATFSGGTTTFTGATELTTANFNGGTVNFATNSLTIGTFNRGAGNINFKLADGATQTTYNLGAISGANSGIMTIDQGVTVNATSIANNSWYAAGSRTLDVDGVLNISQNMTLHMDGRGERFQGSGVINVGGNANLTVWGDVNMGVGELNVTGNLSVGAYWGQTNFNINDGVVSVGGVFNNSSDSNVVNLNICGGSLVLKGSSEMKKDTLNISAGSLEQAAGSTTISNTVSMTGGVLRVSGGVMNITSTAVSATGGSIAVSGGELVLGAEAADALLGGADTVSLTGGVLDVGGVTFSASGGIALGGTMSVSGGMIELGSSMTATNTDYAIFDLTAEGASLDNWENMKSNISVGGVSLLRYEGATLSLTDDAASLSFSSLEKSTFDDLQWSGGASGTWDYATANWDRTGDDADTLYSFANGDSVSFNTDAAVTLSQAITANNVTITNGATVSLDESAGKLSATSISVGEGAKLSLSAVRTDANIGSNITGLGTVELSAGTGWSSVITMGNGFTGETHLKQGQVTLVHDTNGSAVVGSKLVLLADEADIQLTNIGNQQTTWAGNLELRGTHDLHSNSTTDFTFAGNVTGTGTYTKMSTGKLTFGENGSVNLGKFTQDGNPTETSLNETYFKGVTTLGGLEASKGAVYFSGATTTLTGTASATTLNLTGGAMKVNFTSANGATITDNASGSFTVGTLNYTGGTLEMSGTVNITTLKVGAGLTATVYNNGATAGQNKTFGTVELGAGATLKTYDNAKVTKATDFGTLKFMGDSATIQDAWHAGYYHVDALTMGEGVTSSTLNLKKTASSSLATVFELGNAGDTTSNFAGKINLQQTNAGKGRSAFVVLSNANIAQNAVISMTDASDTTESAYIGLGINADQTTIAGLESNEANGSIAKLFSGKIGTQVEWTAKTDRTTPPDTVGDEVRTLNITTKAGGEHEFYGEVLGSLNLVIDGEGTQKFLGTSNSFNGTVTVQGGTAAFNDAGTSLLEHTTAFTLSNEGVLDLSAISFGTDSTNAIALASGATFTFSDNLDNDGGLVIDLGSLSADTTYQIFDLSAENASLVGWNLDTLDLANFRVNGALLADREGYADISLGENGTFSYTFTDPDAVTLHWSGAASGTWNTTDAKWDATPDDDTDALVVYDPDVDVVVFNDKTAVTLTLGEDITANTITIKDSNTHAFQGDKNLTVDSFVGESSSATIGLGGDGNSLTVTISESSDIKGTLDVYWGTTLNLEGLHHEIGTLITRANSSKNSEVTVAAKSATFGSIEMKNSSALNFNLAEGQKSSTYTVTGAITTTTNNTTGRTISVAENVALTIGSLDNSYGLGSLTVDGTMSITGDLLYSYANGTNEQKIDGSGSLTVNGTTSISAGTLKVTNGNVSFVGKTTIGNNAKLVLDCGNTYTLANNVEGAGTLEIAADTTLANNGKVISAHLVLNGGNATVNDKQKLQGNVTVKSGATLTASNNDIMQYSGTHVLTVEEGGVVDFGSYRQTMGSYWKISLSGGEIRGAGGSYSDTDATYTAAIDNHDENATFEVNATSGESEISATTGLRKDTGKLKYNVAEDALLTVSGAVQGNGAVTKDGDGKLIMSAANTYGGGTTITAGTLELQGAGKLGKGNVSIAAGAELAAATTATLDGEGNVTAESETWASITSTSDTAAATVSGATITQTEATKTLAVAGRSTDGTRGTMVNTLVQIAADATLTVDSMMISPGSRISGAASLYATRAAESSLAQVQLSNSILQLDTSNSTVADAPATMDLGTLQAIGSSDAGGALTLGAASKVLTVSTDVFSNLALTSGTDFVVDFSSLLSSIDVADADFVYLSFADTVSADWSTTTLTGTWNDYQMDAYYHTAVAAGAAIPNVGVYFDVRTIPEPTSTTLSILALAALAARRRRK